MTCPDCEKLQKIVAELKKEVEELKRRLALYENAHTPPSQRRYPARQDGGRRTGKRFPGRPKGHKGTTRPVPQPDVVVKPEWKKCPRCGGKLGKPSRVKRRIVEDIPEPQPVVVKEFLEFEGDCPKCGAHIMAKHPDCPPEGRFGKNLLVQISLWKYEGRLCTSRVGGAGGGHEAAAGGRVPVQRFDEFLRVIRRRLVRKTAKKIKRIRSSPTNKKKRQEQSKGTSERFEHGFRLIERGQKSPQIHRTGHSAV